MNLIEVAPRGALCGLAVVLHGRGATKEDLVPIGELLALDGWHCVHPDAPIPWGGEGFAWYESETRARDLPASRALVAALVREKQRGLSLPADRTVVLGFSQGGVVSLDVTLNEGVATRAGCLSGYLSEPEAPRAPKGPLNVFQAHGTADDLITVQTARKSKRALEAMKIAVAYEEYDMAHEILPEEILALRGWLKA
jgi:phospholipase/carboxylesterase